MNYFISLAEAKNHTPPRLERGSDKLAFGPRDPMNNFDALSLEDELEREIRALAARVNRAFSFGLVPRRGAEVVPWLRAHLAEVSEWNPALATEVEETLADQADRADHFLNLVYKHETVTEEQVEDIEERFEHNRVLLPVNKAAAVLTDFFGVEIQRDRLRYRARHKFGLVKKDGVENVDLVRAMCYLIKEGKYV